jgi:hypothetical protein
MLVMQFWPPRLRWWGYNYSHPRRFVRWFSTIPAEIWTAVLWRIE